MPRHSVTMFVAGWIAVAAAYADGGPTTVPATGPATEPTTGPALVDGPQYARWARFKPGASVRLAGDVDLGADGAAHVEMTQTLAAVTADAVTVDVSQVVTVQGQRQTLPAERRSFPARQPPTGAAVTGVETVVAGGRSHRCDVVVQPVAAGPNAGATVTTDVDLAVPGGVVRVTAPGPGGRPLVLTLAESR